jgi:hypothetical protein
MKSIYLILWLYIITVSCKEEADKRIPGSVKASFSKRYPEAVDIKWEEVQNQYQAKFKIDGQDKQAIFAPNGSVLIEESKPINNLIESD